MTTPEVTTLAGMIAAASAVILIFPWLYGGGAKNFFARYWERRRIKREARPREGKSVAVDKKEKDKKGTSGRPLSDEAAWRVFALFLVAAAGIAAFRYFPELSADHVEWFFFSPEGWEFFGIKTLVGAVTAWFLVGALFERNLFRLLVWGGIALTLGASYVLSHPEMEILPDALTRDRAVQKESTEKEKIEEPEKVTEVEPGNYISCSHENYSRMKTKGDNWRIPYPMSGTERIAVCVPPAFNVRFESQVTLRGWMEDEKGNREPLVGKVFPSVHIQGTRTFQVWLDNNMLPTKTEVRTLIWRRW